MHHTSLPAVRQLLLPFKSAFQLAPFSQTCLSTQDSPFACSLCLCQRKLPAPMLSMLPPPAHSHIALHIVADSSIYSLTRSLTHSLTHSLVQSCMHSFIHPSAHVCSIHACVWCLLAVPVISLPLSLILDECFPQACAVLSGSLSEGLSRHMAPL